LCGGANNIFPKEASIHRERERKRRKYMFSMLEILDGEDLDFKSKIPVSGP